MGLLQLPVEHNQTFFNSDGFSFISQQGFGGLQEKGDGAVHLQAMYDSNQTTALLSSGSNPLSVTDRLKRGECKPEHLGNSTHSSEEKPRFDGMCSNISSTGSFSHTWTQMLQ